MSISSIFEELQQLKRLLLLQAILFIKKEKLYLQLLNFSEIPINHQMQLL
jgi:hypothetical protein